MEVSKPTLTIKEQGLLKKMQLEIVSCDHDFSIGHFYIGVETEIDELFYKFNIEEKLQNKFLKNLRCPECGNEDFDMASLVGLRSQYDKNLDLLYNKADKKYSKAIKEFETLHDRPSLAFKSPIARKIYKELKDGFGKTISLNGKYFRGRIAQKPEGSNEYKQFTTDDMLLPPIGFSSEGRYNNNGQPHLYLADCQQGARMETCQNYICDKDTFVQEFELAGTINNILDLSHDFYEISLNTPLIFVVLFDFISSKKRNKINYKPDYFITKYIMDCARDLNYKGIQYNSAISKPHKNLVLFEIPLILKPIGNPIFLGFEKEDEFKTKVIDF